MLRLSLYVYAGISTIDYCSIISYGLKTSDEGKPHDFNTTGKMPKNVFNLNYSVLETVIKTPDREKYSLCKGYNQSILGHFV